MVHNDSTYLTRRCSFCLSSCCGVVGQECAHHWLALETRRNLVGSVGVTGGVQWFLRDDGVPVLLIGATLQARQGGYQILPCASGFEL
jgi:hypothetical protein